MGLAAVALAILAVGAAGTLSPYLSNVVERNLGTVQVSVTLVVSPVPANLSAGDVVTVEATLVNNAHRPLPAVLRMEVRNGDGISPDDMTVYAGCGAEEQWTSKTLRYYVGWHGPLLAPNGTAFPVGTSVEDIEVALGTQGHWQAVLAEVQARDPRGYAALVEPGTNASAGIRASPSLALKALNYFGMVVGDSGSPAPTTWYLRLPFVSHWMASGDGRGPGFDVEVSPNARGTYSLRLWAERPDGLGVPNHPWRCGPL